ncbi:LysM peptidoglycan-binding domain-containing protein [Paenibacillus sp. GCM10012307]
MNELRSSSSSINARGDNASTAVKHRFSQALLGLAGRHLAGGIIAVLLFSSLFSFLFIVQSNASNYQDVTYSKAVVPDSRFVIVSAGDTLWEIAKRYKPKDAGLGQFVYELQQFNNIKSTIIHAGDIILIPVK